MFRGLLLRIKRQREEQDKKTRQEEERRKKEKEEARKSTAKTFFGYPGSQPIGRRVMPTTNPTYLTSRDEPASHPDASPRPVGPSTPPRQASQSTEPPPPGEEDVNHDDCKLEQSLNTRPPRADVSPRLPSPGIVLPDLSTPPPNFKASLSSPSSNGHVLLADFSRPPPTKRRKETPAGQTNGLNWRDKKATTCSDIERQAEKAVTPLCSTPIEKQLNMKLDATFMVLSGLRHMIMEANPDTVGFFRQQEERLGYYLSVANITPSPETDGYRNKCDFSIGFSPQDRRLAIGFRLQQGNSLVGPIGHLRSIPERMKRLVRRSEMHLQGLGLSPYDPKEGTGALLSLTMRLTREDQAMLTLGVSRRNLAENALRDLKADLIRFAEEKGAEDNITSLYLLVAKDAHGTDSEYVHLYGARTISERVLGRALQISPQSFFPANTSCAEETYNVIAESVDLNGDCTLVDVCCGTGSIALSLSSRCGQWLGIDAEAAAIDDARVNALANDITNGEFFPGSAEEYLGCLWRRAIFPELVCVVDPPRTGLQLRAINHIRKEERVTKVVFLCSDAPACTSSLVALTRPPSNNVKGDPFFPVRAIPIDTFPHTNDFSIAFIYHRLTRHDLLDPNLHTKLYAKFAQSSLPRETLAKFQSGDEPLNRSSAANPSWSVNGMPSDEVDLDPVVAAKLTSSQISWLNQMNVVCGPNFDSAGWARSLAASWKPSTPAEWGEHSKRYSEYMQRRRGHDGKSMPPLPAGPPPAAS